MRPDLSRITLFTRCPSKQNSAVTNPRRALPNPPPPGLCISCVSVPRPSHGDAQTLTPRPQSPNSETSQREIGTECASERGSLLLVSSLNPNVSAPAAEFKSSFDFASSARWCDPETQDPYTRNPQGCQTLIPLKLNTVPQTQYRNPQNLKLLKL